MIENMNDPEQESHCSLNREEKLRWLMQSYGNDVIRIAYSYVKQKPLAEDIAQDVFIKCYEKMETFRNESSYKTWIISITVNRCKDVLRSWSFRNILLTELLIDKQVNTSIELQLFGDDENQTLSKAVIKLPIKLREVIILYYYQDFSIEEISNLLKSNPKQLKQDYIEVVLD
jgi:RNA polymerase sigma factor (sigma-70 family)